MSVQTLELIADVAARASKRYARSVFWADPEDLKQQALLAALSAARPGLWDERVGVPFEAYVWRACMNSLKTYLWRNSSPVSETDHRLETLRGVHRASLGELNTDDGTAVLGTVMEAHLESFPEVDELVDQKMWVEEARDQLSFLLIERQGVRAAELALRVLIDGEKPSQVAAEASVPPEVVYRASCTAKKHISQNVMLYSLWERL